MYERFTDRARKVMQLANQEAQRFNHEYIGTEHILLGLVKEGSGVAVNVLKNLDIDLRKIRLEVEKIVHSGPVGEQVVMGKLPHTPRAKRVIEDSIEEARNLIDSHVGTEHLLLGLIREEEGVAARVLMNLGVSLSKVREQVLSVQGRGSKENASTPTTEEVQEICVTRAILYVGPRGLVEKIIKGSLRDGTHHIGGMQIQIHTMGYEKELAQVFINPEDFPEADDATIKRNIHGD